MELDLDFEAIHDYVYEGDELFSDLGYAADLEVTPFDDDEPDFVEVDMTVIFEDKTEVHILVQAPNKVYALAALRQAGGPGYINALSDSLDGEE